MVDLTKVREHQGRSDPALLFVRDNYMKTSALPYRRASADVAVMVVDYAFCDCQPKTRSLVFCLGVQSLEQVEDNLKILFLYADAVITNVDLKVPRCVL